MPVIPPCKTLRQEDNKFEASLDYIVRSSPAWTIQWDLSQENK